MILKDLSSVYKTFAALERPLRIVVVEAKDDFFRDDCVERYIALWKAWFPQGRVQRGPASLLLDRRHDIENPYPLFPTAHLWIIAPGRGKKNSDLLPIIVQSAHQDHFFLFVDDESIAKELAEQADKAGMAISLPSLKPSDRQVFQGMWIQSYIRKKGSSITQEAADLLIQGFGQDRAGMISELDKLITYRLDEAGISRTDVESVGAVEVQPTLWQLLDGLLNGDAGSIARSLAQPSETHDIAVLRFIKNQLERLVLAVQAHTPPRNKSAERQMRLVRHKGIPTVVSWINRMVMHEAAIRSGREEEGALFPLFLSLVC